MAVAVVCRRVGQLGMISRNGGFRFGAAVSGSFPPVESKFCNRFGGYNRKISDLVKANGNHVFLVDTLALARMLEEGGVPSKQAEVITAAMTKVLNDSFVNMTQLVVSKAEMQRTEMIQETNLCKFKTEIQTRQEHHFSLFQHEAEKMHNAIEKSTEKTQNDIDKTRSNLKHEIDKVNAGQRLDWNLEKGRLRDDMAHQSTQITNLDNKFDRELHSQKAQWEAAKYDMTKYFVGTLFSISAVGLAVVRILM